MVFLLFSTILILTVLAGVGSLWPQKIRNGFSTDLVNGIFILSIVWTLLSFFIPLNLYVEIISVVIGIFLFFIHKKYLDVWTFLKSNHKTFVPFSLMILFAGSFFPFILDHFGYYVPSIIWIGEFGLVKGISNLEIVLGQMSVWHIFQTGFSHFSDPFLRINPIFLIVYLIYILEKKSDVHLLFIPILLLFSQSPSPDLPVIVFSLMILNEIFDRNSNTSRLFTLAAFTFMHDKTHHDVGSTARFSLFCFRTEI